MLLPLATMPSCLLACHILGHRSCIGKLQHREAQREKKHAVSSAQGQSGFRPQRLRLMLCLSPMTLPFPSEPIDTDAQLQLYLEMIKPYRQIWWAWYSQRAHYH